MFLPPLLNDLPTPLKKSPIASKALPNHLPIPFAKSTAASTKPFTKLRNFLLCLYSSTNPTASPTSATTRIEIQLALATALNIACAAAANFKFLVTSIKPPTKSLIFLTANAATNAAPKALIAPL